MILKTYRLGELGTGALINETYEKASRYRGWSYQPGDIVRKQMFEEDRNRPPREFPIGIVIWACDQNSVNDVGILWSTDPDR